LALDDLGVSYIEGGWPSSNPKDREFFKQMKEHKLSNSKLAAFGSTKRKDTKPSSDPSLNSILDSEVKTAVLFGKSWLLHVKDILKVTPEENLSMIYDSVEYLRAHGLEVIFDAEHFYKGFATNKEYALKVLETARSAGSRAVVLCDTNGGTPPNVFYSVTKEVAQSMDALVGVHTHNDMGCAVANAVLGVAAGARHVQGTINGIGERTGNSDLVQVLPTLSLSLGYDTVGRSKLKSLKDISMLVYSLAEMQPDPYQPFVGEDAFAHKGGIHADAVRKNVVSYEHMDPALVGNKRKIIISELSGSSNLLSYADALGLDIDKNAPGVKSALAKIKSLEHEGYSFDLAPASAILILLKEMGMYSEYIKLDYWKVLSEGALNIAVVKGKGIHEVSEGDGPVNALDNAVRKIFLKVYPELKDIILTDYRVVLPGSVKNTESVVRVIVEFSTKGKSWRCVGVSKNMIDASVKAHIDGFNYYLWLRKVKHR
jgi:2-isopropylmalate synthase